ncbi:MAG TPA: hypothetical protein VKQ30_12160 [Ktedonobacterales bacterium]|nr:hypothetical protein [Ktedonobacterales bacterium]
MPDPATGRALDPAADAAGLMLILGPLSRMRYNNIKTPLLPVLTALCDD